MDHIASLRSRYMVEPMPVLSWRSHKLPSFAWHFERPSSPTSGTAVATESAPPAIDAGEERPPRRAARANPVTARPGRSARSGRAGVAGGTIRSRQPVTMLTAGTHAVPMPQLGFGVYKIPAARCREAVTTALGVGYRAIDTASFYENERAVGAALARTDVPRSEIFLTTKVWNDCHGYDETLRSFEASSRRLQQRCVDLLLIHWPCPAQDRYVDSWRALLRLREEGRIRVAGVSNFDVVHLQRLMDETGEAPAINQVELHPYLQQLPLRAFHAEHGIATQAWGPLARGGELLHDSVITAIAAELGRTPAQVVLRWHLQQGNAAIPKSADPHRMAENFAVFDFDLAPGHLAAIEALDRGLRTGPDPATMT